MMLAAKLLSGMGGEDKLYVDDVFAVHLYTGNGSTQTINNGIDLAGKGGLVWIKCRNTAGAGFNNYLCDSVRGFGNVLSSDSTEGAGTISDGITSVSNTGYALGSRAGFNASTKTYASWTFRKAPKFFDVVTYTGTGTQQTINHSLGQTPGMIICKKTSSSGAWIVWTNALTVNEYLTLNTTDAKATFSGAWGSTAPSSTQFQVGTAADNNESGFTYVAYLFATLPGISKVGSYTGNGSSQVINCGFTTGARFILIKRTDATGDWYVWDTARGIVASNDPHLSLNTMAAEVTTDDSVDPAATGFIVNQNTATNINVSGASYSFLAIA